MIDLLIETRCLSLQELWAVSSAVRHRRLHQWVTPRELLRPMRYQGPRTAFPLCSRRYMPEKLHNKILCLLSDSAQQPRHSWLPPLRAATRAGGRQEERSDSRCHRRPLGKGEKLPLRANDPKASIPVNNIIHKNRHFEKSEIHPCEYISNVYFSLI